MAEMFAHYFENAFVEQPELSETAAAAMDSAKEKAERLEDWERWQTAILMVLIHYPEAHAAVLRQVQELRAEDEQQRSPV